MQAAQRLPNNCAPFVPPPAVTSVTPLCFIRHSNGLGAPPTLALRRIPLCRPPVTARYALRTKGITSSAIRELLKITQKPGMISFAGGLPAPEVFPGQRFEEACHKV